MCKDQKKEIKSGPAVEDPYFRGPGMTLTKIKVTLNKIIFLPISTGISLKEIKSSVKQSVC